MKPMSTDSFNKIIEIERNNIRKELLSYDKRFKTNGKNTFKILLDDIDKGKASKVDVYRRVLAMLQKAMLSNRVKDIEAKAVLYDQSKLDSIMLMAQRYRISYNSVYIISKDDLNYIDALLDEGFIDEAKELYDLFGEDEEDTSFEVNIICNDTLYLGILPNLNCKGKYSNASKRILLFSSDKERYGDLEEPVYTASIGLSAEKERLEITHKKLATISTSDLCKNCKEAKESKVTTFGDGSRRIKCNWLETNKCQAFNKKLRPEELLQAILAVVYSFNHRSEYDSNSKNNNAQSSDITNKDNQPVIIYIKDTIEDIKKLRGEHRQGNHTSPREHNRKGCMVKYKSGKVGYRKGCIVNEGKEKTTYAIRVSKKLKDKLNEEENVGDR